MSLSDWLRYGWLVEHQTTQEEIRDLFAIVERDLEDSRLEALSPDWKLNIAYNAALQAGTAALAACGFRAAREAHHYRVIQSLAHTIGAPRSLIARLDLFRKKRNLGGYERPGTISEQDAREMIVLAQEIHEEAHRWFSVNRPDLL